MKSDLMGLVDPERIRPLLEGYARSTGIASLIVDPAGTVLWRSNWQRICDDFHRRDPRACRRCVASDRRLLQRLDGGEPCALRTCPHGLTDAAAPLFIGDRLAAALLFGQFLTAPPDPAAFRRNAARFGFAEADYLESLARVRIVTKETLPHLLDCLTRFARLIGEDLPHPRGAGRRPGGASGGPPAAPGPRAGPAGEETAGEETLHFLTARDWNGEKRDYFASLAMHLGGVLEVEYAFTSTLLPGGRRARTEGSYALGRIVPDTEYELATTPCALVMGKTYQCFPDRVRPLFPHNTYLEQLGAESYAGIPLWDSEGSPIGLIAVLGKKPFSDPGKVRSVLQVAAIRTAHELERKRDEETLQQREELLELFFSQSLDGFFFMMLDEPLEWNGTVDKDGALDYAFAHQRLTRVNDAMLTQYGATREQMLGLTPAELFAHDPAQGRAAWRRLFDAGKLHLDTQERRFDGTPMWIEGDYICLHDKRGRITGHFGIQREVTARKRAEEELQAYRDRLEERVAERTAESERARQAALTLMQDANLQRQRAEKALADARQMADALRKSEERVRRILDTSYEGFLLIDNEAVLLEVNGSMCRILGREREQVLGRNLQEFVDPACSEALRDQVEQRLQGRGGAHELSILRPDGSRADCLLNGTPLFDEEGKAAGSFAMVTDITQRKTDMERISLLSQATEQSPATVVITDRSGTIQFVNARFAEVTGYETREAIGRNPRILSSGIHPREHYEDMWRTIRSGRVWRGEFCNRRKDGRLYWEDAMISPITDETGTISKYVAVKVDITARKLMEEGYKAAKEEAESASRAKSEFLANMSHEIRTPINAIVGLTYLFERTSLDGRQRDYIEKIQLASNHLLSIVNDILDFSKIEAQKVTLESVAFDLEEVLRDVLRMNAYKAQEKGLELNLELAAGVPVRLTGDPARLGQVLLNLLSNAIKFTEKGEVLLRVELDRRQEGWAVLRFAVEDTGIGIAAEMKERIFGPFAQADTSTSRRFGGTGLGLAISRNLVEMMGGQVEVRSEPGQGSTFLFTATFGLAEPAAEAGRGPPGGRRGLRVLVVDDNRTTLSILAGLLAPQALEVTTAASGAEGLRKWRPGCDLLLVDSRLPDMDGLELVRRIRAMAGDDCAPRVLLMVGAGRPDLQRETEQVRVDGFLAKPFVPSDLVGAVSAAFGLLPEARAAGGDGGGEGEAAAGRLAEARVLLVEDNDINRQVIRELLGSLGVRVTCAANGQEALQILDGGEERFEAILMDLQMPVMDGYQTAVRIRKNPRCREVPIIAITADVVSGVKDRVALAGMNAYLSKPLRIAELVGVLSRWIPVAPGPPGPGAGTAAAPSSPLAALKGIDARRGLSLANGNEALYRGLLASFAARWRGEAERLRGLLEAGGREEAALSLHTLKGLAATLGAERLRAEAAAAEARLREPGAPAEPGGRALGALGALEEALREVLAAIEGLPAADPPPRGCGEAAGADGEAAARLYPVLRELLRAHNGDAVEHFRQFSRAAGGEHRAALERVEGLIGRYDFEEALAELERLFGAPGQGPS